MLDPDRIFYDPALIFSSGAIDTIVDIAPQKFESKID